MLLAALPAPSLSTRAALIAILAVIALAIRFRAPIGMDGSDQMSSILFTALALAHFVPGQHTVDLVLWFITLQTCLAYVTAGSLKAKEQGWRDGSYLARIFTTATYGIPRFGEYLKEHQRLAAVMALTVIGIETLFPLVFVIPQRGALALLAATALFHVGSAAIMGLNTFVWSFLATYPAVLYCRTMIHG